MLCSSLPSSGEGFIEELACAWDKNLTVLTFIVHYSVTTLLKDL